MSKYPLSVLVKMRETARDQAVTVYAASTARRQAAQQAPDVATAGHQRLSAAHARARQNRSEETDLSQLSAWSDFIDGLEAEIRAQVQVVDAARSDLSVAEAHLAETRRAMALAEKELQAVQQHQEKWQGERNAATAKRAADALDDLAIQRWSKQ